MNNVSLNYCSLIANKPQHRISSTVSFVKIFHVSPFFVSAAFNGDRTKRAYIRKTDQNTKA